MRSGPKLHNRRRSCRDRDVFDGAPHGYVDFGAIPKTPPKGRNFCVDAKRQRGSFSDGHRLRSERHNVNVLLCTLMSGINQESASKQSRREHMGRHYSTRFVRPGLRFSKTHGSPPRLRSAQKPLGSPEPALSFFLQSELEPMPIAQRTLRGKIWWAHLDSNQGPTGYEPVALTS